ncbi:sensor histidine kinase [Roseicella frigidaeris]|nr:sensor histidine kinase [Roseicella frigidaeris]
MHRMPQAAGPDAAAERPAGSWRLRASTLLLLLAVLLPPALLPLSQVSPLLATEAARLSRQAGEAAIRLAEALPPPPAAGQRPAEMPALAALLAETAPADAWITLLDAEGRVLGRSPALPAERPANLLSVEQAVPGWPLRIRALRAAPPPQAGLLPLAAGLLALALLGLALLVHRREQLAVLAARTAARGARQQAAAMAEAAAQLRLALGASGLGCWSWEEATDRLRCDARAAAILGWSGGGGSLASLADCADPADRPRLAACLDAARRQDAPAHCTLRLDVRPGRATRWIELRAQATEGPDGITWHGVLADITDRHRAEEEQHLLLREVDHRAKNTLAVVQALLRLTRNEDPATLVPRVEARIAAMARAHTLLAQSRWQGAPLRRLLEGEFGRPAGEGAAGPRLEGPAVMLAAVAAQPLAMVVHELASQARQDGALSRPDGQLAIRWSLAADGGLMLAWEEAAAEPAPAPAPARGGLGTRIVEATVRDQLGGRIERSWDQGLRCVIHLPPTSLRPGPVEAAA